LHRRQQLQAVAQRRRQLGGARLVFRGGRLGQQQARFQIGQPCRPHQVVGGDLPPHPPLRGDKGKVLVGKGEDRNPRPIDLLLARQGQQEVDRSFVAVEVEDQGGLRFACRRQARRAGLGVHPCPVIFRTNWSSSRVGTPISQPSRLKPIPARTPR